MKGASIKNSHSFFSQYFRQSRPLNQVILMTELIEKTKIKSIASRVRSSQILGDWIPDYRSASRVPAQLAVAAAHRDWPHVEVLNFGQLSTRLQRTNTKVYK